MDWLLVVAPGVMWGASFLFIAEGLQAVAPMGVTFVRIAIGFVTLSRRSSLTRSRTASRVHFNSGMVCSP